jgi:hypothetical protein
MEVLSEPIKEPSPFFDDFNFLSAGEALVHNSSNLANDTSQR